MPIQPSIPIPSNTITLTYTCSHTRIFRIEEVTPAAYNDNPVTTNDAGETILFAPPNQADVILGAMNLALMSAGEREKKCPACCKAVSADEDASASGEGWEEVRKEEGEVLFDVDVDSSEGEEPRDGEGWWDILNLEAEDAEAEMMSDGEVDGGDDDELCGKAVKPYEVV
ncbi:MAG: hypothetical protein Q9225_006537 [Loekoesia sp. 1 TL-2023]